MELAREGYMGRNREGKVNGWGKKKGNITMGF